ncbi:hypothetical protein JYQ62_19060 [Nostoc sp. UHCC 0702]|nr:hypothetical protein JYQ62_19060 [Nostoc sp. UHCC 0702]
MKKLLAYGTLRDRSQELIKKAMASQEIKKCDRLPPYLKKERSPEILGSMVRSLFG